jgi:hypothetical protein
MDMSAWHSTKLSTGTIYLSVYADRRLRNAVVFQFLFQQRGHMSVLIAPPYGKIYINICPVNFG